MGDGQLKGHEIAFHLNFGLKGRHVRRSSRRRKVKRPDEIRAKTSRRSKQTAPRGHAATLLKYLSSASSASWMVLPWGFKLWLEHPNCRSIEGNAQTTHDFSSEVVGPSSECDRNSQD